MGGWVDGRDSHIHKCICMHHHNARTISWRREMASALITMVAGSPSAPCAHAYEAHAHTAKDPVCFFFRKLVVKGGNGWSIND